MEAKPLFSLRRSAGNLLFPLLAAFLPVPMEAQPLFELEPFPVRNNPVIEEIVFAEGGDPVTRVGREQIHALGGGDLSASLRRVPGVVLSRYNVVGAFGGGDGGAIFIRGQGAGRPGAQIVTLTDGIPRFVGVWTHPLLDTLPSDFASSIEVFKSPQPVRYGNMAFGAVNVIPARASGEGWSGSVRGEYGAWETSALLAEAGFANEAFNLYAGYSRRESDGHRANADGEVEAFQARGAWTAPGGWEISLLSQFVESMASDPERRGAPVPVTETYAVENQFYLGQIRRESGDLSLSLKAYAEAGELDWRQWHAPPPPPFPAQVLFTRTHYGNHGLRGRAAWDDGNLLVAGGMDFDSYGGRVTEDYALASDNRFNEERFHLAAPFLETEWRRNLDGDASRLVLSAGTRYFVHDVFADKAAWQLAGRLESGPTAVYLAHARSHNYPGVFVSVFGRRPPPWNVGEDWRDLDPESIDHYELGFRLQANSDAVLNLAVFHDEVSDALRIAPPPPAGRIFNLGDYRVRGAELSLQWEYTPALRIFSGLTWLDADADVPNAPELTLSLAAQWEPLSGWLIDADVQHVGSQRIIDTRFDNPRGSVGAYSLVNFRISRHVALETGRLEIYLRADNVLDESYEHRPGYPMPGASLTGGLRFAF